MKHELKNGNPTPDAIHDALESLGALSVLLKIDMGQARAHPCGTTACFAGAYAIARGIENRVDSDFIKSGVDYSVGANWLAQDLGFTGKDDLSNWAAAKPRLWGNKSGTLMFHCERAFGLQAGAPICLDNIRNHLLGVADRIRTSDLKKLRRAELKEWIRKG